MSPFKRRILRAYFFHKDFGTDQIDPLIDLRGRHVRGQIGGPLDGMDVWTVEPCPVSGWFIVLCNGRRVDGYRHEWRAVQIAQERNRAELRWAGRS